MSLVCLTTEVLYTPIQGLVYHLGIGVFCIGVCSYQNIILTKSIGQPFLLIQTLKLL